MEVAILVAIPVIYLAGWYLFYRWNDYRWKNSKSWQGFGVHEARGIVVLGVWFVGLTTGYFFAYLAGKQEHTLELSLLHLTFILVGGAVLLSLYFGGNHIRRRASWFHTWFDQDQTTLYLQLMQLLSLCLSLISGAALFYGFGNFIGLTL